MLVRAVVQDRPGNRDPVQPSLPFPRPRAGRPDNACPPQPAWLLCPARRSRSSARPGSQLGVTAPPRCLFIHDSFLSTDWLFFLSGGGEKGAGGKAGAREGTGRGSADSTINNGAAEPAGRRSLSSAQSWDAGLGPPRGQTPPDRAASPGFCVHDLRSALPACRHPRRPGWSSRNWIRAASSLLPAPNREAG